MSRSTRTLPIVALLTFSSILALAQSVPEFTVTETVLGKSFTGSEVRARVIEFKDWIENIFPDTTLKMTTLQLRRATKNGKGATNSGFIVRVDPISAKVAWSNDFSFLSEEFTQFNDVLIGIRGRQTSVLNPATGKVAFTFNNEFRHIDVKKKIAIGYGDQGDGNTMQGLDLRTGSILWTRSVDRSLGWEFIPFDDSSGLVIAAGLHRVNLYTGKGWKHELITGEKSRAQIGTSLLLGTRVQSPVLNGIISNYVQDGTRLLIASRTKLVCLNSTTGKVVWSTELPEEMMSRSNIFIVDKRLYLVNRGMAFANQETVSFGKPFLAAYSLEDGHPLYTTHMPLKQPILSLQVHGNTITVVSGNQVIGYTLETGSLTAKNLFAEKTFGSLNGLLGDLRLLDTRAGTAHILTPDSILHRLPPDGTDKLFLATSKDALILDDQLQITGQIPRDDAYTEYDSWNGMLLLYKTKDPEWTLVGRDEQKVAGQIRVPETTMIQSNMLIAFKGKKMFIIDLTTSFGK